MKRFLLSILFFVGVVSFGFGQSTGDFRSRATGIWNDSNTWEEWTGSSWVNTANIPVGTANQIELVAGFSVTISAGITINISSSTTLLNNGTLIIATSGRNNGVLRIEGVMTSNQGSITSGTSTSKLLFLAGSIYNHNFTTTEGTIPTASWASNSTARIIGYTSNGTSPNGLSQAFHHFTWDCTNMSTAFFNLAGNLNNVNGDLTIFSTGTGSLSMSDFTSTTINIGGSLLISGNSEVYFNYQQPVNYNIGSDLQLSSSLTTYFGDEADLTLNIGNDLIVNGTGTYDFGGFSGLASTNIFITRNFTISNGTIQATGSGVKTINFNSGLTSEFSRSGGSVSGAINYVIGNSTTLDLGTSALQGAGDFQIGAGSLLITANLNGIQLSPTSSGAIQLSGTRTYSAGSSIEYNGASNQALGSGFPSSGVNLIINNLGGINLNGNRTIGGTLTFTNGNLIIGNGNTLTLNGSTSGSGGGISGGEFYNLSIGGSGAFGTLGFVGTNELGDFTLNRGSSGSVTLGADLLVNGALLQSNGDLLLGGNTLTISGDYTQSGGTLISNSSSSLVINTTGTLPAGLSFSGDINTITLDRASTTLNTAASAFTATNLNLYSGTLDGTAISIADGGTLERRTNGVLANALTAVGSYNLIYDHSTALNTGAELPNSATAINNIEKKGTGVLTVQNDFTANGSLTFTNGSFNAGANTISLNGDLVANAGSTLINSTITFDGTTNLTGSNNPTFGSITVNGTFNPAADLTVNGDITNNGILNSSAGTLTINATSQLGGSNPINVNNFTIGASGNVTASSTQALEINGNFTNNGSFAANGGTVAFVGNTTISGTVPDFANIQVEGIFNAPSTLNLSGSLTNNGTFNDGDGIINMIGGSARAIAGTSAFNIHTLNLDGSTVSNNNTGGVSIENGITLAANTIFDADGSGTGLTTLLSTSSTDAAYVGQIPSTSSVTGNITVQRYFSTGRFWRYLGSPVTNSTVADWQDEFPITGTFSDPSTGSFDGSTLNSSAPSLFYYDAAGSAYVAYPTSGTAASNPISNGTGYSLFLRNNISNIIGAVTGELKQQSASIPVADNGDPNESWNLVANPYAAPIDWDAAGWTKTNVANEVHIPLVSSGGFATYIGGVSANGGSRYIASGQAFWIRTVGTSPDLTAVESVKSVNENPTYFRTAPLELFRIEMLHADLSDEIVFSLRDEATFGFDEDFDANRRLNINGFGYTLSTTGDDGRKLKINSIPKVVDSDCSVSIPINMESVSKTGEFKLSFSEVINLLNYYTVDFVDNYENELITVESDFEYNYVINSDAGSKASDRFSLILNNKEIGVLTNLSNLDACASSEVSYSLNNLNDNYNYSIYKEDLKLSDVSNQTTASINIPDSLLLDSVNEFEVYGNAGTCDSVKVGTFIVNVVDSNINLDVNVIGSNICPQATQGNFELNTENGVKYSVVFGSDTIQTINGDGNLFVGAIKSENLSVGNNVFSIYAEKNKCTFGSLNQQLEIFVDALEIDENIEFTANNTCLKSTADLSFITQDKIDYEIFKGTTLLQTVNGNGAEQTVAIAEANLDRGINEFTIVAKYGKCAQYEFPEPVQIEVEEDINTNLNLITENTCENSNASIVVENAQAGKIYTLKSADQTISSLTAETDGQLTFTVNPTQLSTGLNELDIQIEGEICGTTLSSNKALLTVYEAINSNLEFVTADVCNPAEASIGISNAQAGMTYNLYKDQNLVQTKTASSAGELIFTSANEELIVGLNTFNVKVESEGCGLVEIEESLSITVFGNINPNLEINVTDVCPDEQVNIEIANPQVGKAYRVMQSEEILATETAGTGDVLTFSLPSDLFGIGYHALTVDIVDDNCGIQTANQTAEFELFDNAVIAEVENQNACKDGGVVIDLSSNVAMSSYQLYVGNELVSEVTSSTLNLNPIETTTYSLTGIPVNGCSVNTVNFTVEVTDLATPGILVSGNVLESSIEGDTYQWYLNGQILANENGKVLVANASGDYTVEVSKGNCIKVSDAYTFSEEVLNANRALANAIQLYPNPVEDVLNIDMENIKEIEVTIYTVSGKFMDKLTLDSAKKQSLDMSKFGKGTYLIQLTSGTGTITKRIIKQ